MNDFNCLIQQHLYTLSNKLCKENYERHNNYLKLFKQFLEVSYETSASEIYLDKFYTYYDSNNRLIKYEPIDSIVIKSFFVNYQEKSNNWKYRAKNCLNGFFKSIYQDYDLASPLDNVDFSLNRPNSKKEYKKIHSRHEVLRFINALISTKKETFVRDLVLYTIWLTTGCRPSEILSVKVSDILFDQDQILLSKTKNKKQRILLLSEMLSQDIYRYCKFFHFTGDDYLFLTEKGNPMTLSDLKQLTNFYLTEAKCEYINLYAVRHTFATLLYENEVPIPTIQQALGHASVHTTKEYIHPNYIRNMGVVNKQNSELYKKVSHQMGIFLKNYLKDSGD